MYSLIMEYHLHNKQKNPYIIHNNYVTIFKVQVLFWMA